MSSLKKLILTILPKGLKEKIKWYFASSQLVAGDSIWAKNAKYDFETKTIIQKILKSDSVALDIGAGVGEFTIEMSEQITKGKIHSFEPIPESNNKLNKNTKRLKQCITYDFPLSDSMQDITFNIVDKNLGYSGLKITDDVRRKFKGETTEIKVKTNTIDHLFKTIEQLDFIKVDVEGAEYSILKGGFETIKKFKPTIVFEFMSHAKAYDVDATKMFQLITDLGLNIYNTEYFIQGKDPLTELEFKSQIDKEYEFYFVAAEKNFIPQKEFRFKI